MSVLLDSCARAVFTLLEQHSWGFNLCACLYASRATRDFSIPRDRHRRPGASVSPLPLRCLLGVLSQLLPGAGTFRQAPPLCNFSYVSNKPQIQHCFQTPRAPQWCCVPSHDIPFTQLMAQATYLLKPFYTVSNHIKHNTGI